jgi:hypothetical protein
MKADWLVALKDILKDLMSAGYLDVNLAASTELR